MSLILMASMGLHSAVAAFDDQSSDGTRESAIRESVVKISATLRYPDILHPWTKQSPREASGTGSSSAASGSSPTPTWSSTPASFTWRASSPARSWPPPWRRSAREWTWQSSSSTTNRSSTSGRPWCASRRFPRSRTPWWSTATPRVARACRSPRGSSPGSSSPVTTTESVVSGSRSTRPINPGNSGGPALVDGKMIGLIFSKLTQADNIGYIIPGEEIDLFLKDVADGKYDGKPAMHDSLQTLENPALRGFLRLDKKAQGMIVHTPAESKPDYPAEDLGPDHQDRRHGDRQRRHGEDQGEPAPPVPVLDPEGGQGRQAAAHDRPPGQAPEHRAAGRLAVADADRIAAGPLPVVLRLRPAGLLGGKPRVLRWPSTGPEARWPRPWPSWAAPW